MAHVFLGPLKSSSAYPEHLAVGLEAYRYILSLVVHFMCTDLVFPEKKLESLPRAGFGCAFLSFTGWSTKRCSVQVC